MRRPRFTVRSTMVAVVIAAILLAVWAGLRERRDTYRRAANWHLREARRWNGGGETRLGRGRWREVNWHLGQSDKFADAARYPWLPVGPDPPEPE